MERKRFRLVPSLRSFSSLEGLQDQRQVTLNAITRGLQDQRQVTLSAITNAYHLFIVRHAGKYS